MWDQKKCSVVRGIHQSEMFGSGGFTVHLYILKCALLKQKCVVILPFDPRYLIFRTVHDLWSGTSNVFTAFLILASVVISSIRGPIALRLPNTPGMGDNPNSFIFIRKADNIVLFLHPTKKSKHRNIQIFICIFEHIKVRAHNFA